MCALHSYQSTHSKCGNIYFLQYHSEKKIYFPVRFNGLKNTEKPQFMTTCGFVRAHPIYCNKTYKIEREQMVKAASFCFQDLIFKALNVVQELHKEFTYVNVQIN